jgi:hypothetical protein
MYYFTTCKKGLRHARKVSWDPLTSTATFADQSTKKFDSLSHALDSLLKELGFYRTHSNDQSYVHHQDPNLTINLSSKTISYGSYSIPLSKLPTPNTQSISRLLDSIRRAYFAGKLPDNNTF